MRPTRDEWGLQLAQVTASRSTCLRRSVGCVLVDKRGHILATGYNGVAAGQKHCNEEVSVLKGFEPWGQPFNFEGKMIFTERSTRFEIEHPHACPGSQSPSGTNLDGCQAIHAEQNALLQCGKVWEIDTCYVTASPCMTCVKLLLNTSCQRIVFSKRYPHVGAATLWGDAGRIWLQLKEK